MSKNFWKGSTIFALGVFLYSRMLNDVILLYISSRFIWLVSLGGIAMMLVGASYAVLAFQNRANKTNHDHEHSEECNHEHHEHEHGSPVTWWGLLIALMPLLLGLFVPQQALGADALATRKLNLQTWHAGSVDVALRNNQNAGLLDGEKTIIEWLIEFSNVPRVELAETIADEPVAVTGFVYTDDRFAPNQFMIARYIVTCCVADAQPLGLIVETTGELPEYDSWVAVDGVFGTISFDGTESPAIVAGDIRPINEPRQPYIYIDG